MWRTECYLYLPSKAHFLIPDFMGFSWQTDLSLEELILLWNPILRSPGVHKTMKKQSQKIKGMWEPNVSSTYSFC